MCAQGAHIRMDEILHAQVGHHILLVFCNYDVMVMGISYMPC